MTVLKKTLALLTCACAQAVCGAATVTVKFDSNIFEGSGSDNVTIKFPSLAPGSGVTTLDVAAGRFQGTGSNVMGVPESIFVDGLTDIFMYCYDLYEHIEGGNTVNYTINLNGALARTLDFLGAVNGVLNQGNSTFNPYAWLHPVNGFQGAAIQLGIWESKYETSTQWDLAGGSFRASELDVPTGVWWNQFRSAINSTAALDGHYVMTLESTGAQDMLAGDPPPFNVPEPGSLALLGLGLLGLAAARQRRESPALALTRVALVISSSVAFAAQIVLHLAQ